MYIAPVFHIISSKKTNKTMGLLLFCLLHFMAVVAQEQPSVISRANAAYAKQDYAFAANLYQAKANTVLKSLPLLLKMATCYREINNFEMAAKYYGILTGMSGAPADCWMLYGDMLKATGNYTAAKTAYLQYQQQSGRVIADKIAGCDSAVVWLTRTPNYTIENFKNINTAKSDWGATPFGTDHQLVFVSDSLRMLQKVFLGNDVNTRLYGRTAHSFQKIYLLDSTKAGIDGGAIHNFSQSINGLRYHTGPVGFNAAFDSAYYTITHVGKDKNNTPNSLVRRLELYLMAKNYSGEWQLIKPFAYNAPNSYSVGHAALSRDCNVLYFTSDMPGGVGGLDIWYCERVNDTAWGTPKNCGVLVNTKQDEAFPSIGINGMLYYASKGKIGMGGYDIFSAVGEKDRWTVPVNLGYPINSSGDDFYLVNKDAKTGFFSSNRKEGFGDDDIYKYVAADLPKPKRKIVLETRVEAKDTRMPLPDAAVITSKIDSFSQLTNAEGKVYAEVEEDAVYAIGVSKLGYLPAAETVVTDGKLAADTIRLLVLLNKQLVAGKPAPPKVIRLADTAQIAQLNMGDKIELRNLFYDFDKSNIRPDAAKVLDSLVIILLRFPTMRIELSSHTDSRGNDVYNLALSERRAVAAVNYIISKGINKDRVIAIGYGEMMLTNKCANGVPCTEPEHQMNRRTEVKILNL